MNKDSKDIPLIIAGPMLRHLDADHLTVWLVSARACELTLALYDSQGNAIEIASDAHQQTSYCIGTHAYVQMLRIEQDGLLTSNTLYAYDVTVKTLDKEQTSTLSELLPEMLYPQQAHFNFWYQRELHSVLQGSCRKAHFDGPDALPLIDSIIAQELAEEGNNKRPDMFLMTGDQVYVDDVAGPMLHAIHQVVQRLGLFNEEFEGATVDTLFDLFEHEHNFYQREKLLPELHANDQLTDAFFKAKRKPVFTSVNAHNHLMGVSEMLALYLLSWSSRLWPCIEIESEHVPEQYQQQYQDEVPLIENFAKELSAVERGLAHIPSYMIFDDHDVTDDWNLTRGWEEQVYGNPFSKRIIGNAMAAYFLCQGIGNPQQKLSELMAMAKETFTPEGIKKHDEFLQALFDFDQWHYQLNTSPPIHVLDTRTQRWRSESNSNKPSGLMDWEALCELQHDMIGHESVIMVSAAPVYGVKMIETVQRIFTFFGAALTVDAENWMAHRGTANVMLNMFRHARTPPNFIILSGDVHYSFVYDISLRFRKNSPNITQFTSSGLHNEFPTTLLSWFDRLNQWFYGHRSPLNWLTKRRKMSIRQREPIDCDGYLVNSCNIGLLTLADDGKDAQCQLLCANGKTVNFKRVK